VVTPLIAASVDSEISVTAVEGIPAPYGVLVTAELYEQAAHILLAGALQDSDLKDAFASLAPRPVLVMNPQDPLTRKMFQEEALAAFVKVVSASSQQTPLKRWNSRSCRSKGEVAKKTGGVARRTLKRSTPKLPSQLTSCGGVFH
jgi:hypothetical protein